MSHKISKFLIIVTRVILTTKIETKAKKYIEVIYKKKKVFTRVKEIIITKMFF